MWWPSTYCMKIILKNIGINAFNVHKLFGLVCICFSATDNLMIQKRFGWIKICDSEVIQNYTLRAKNIPQDKRAKKNNKFAKSSLIIHKNWEK